MTTALVIIPTYNEIENLEAIVGRVRACGAEADILVVDDSSPDGTGQLADRLASESTDLHVLHRAQKSGIGDAYRAGFSWGLERSYDLLIEMDADGSHRPEHLPGLITAIEDADVVLGSRWVDGGGAPNWSFRRRLLSRAGSFYARTALRLPIRDVTGGYRVFRAEALRQIRYADVVSQGYCFQVEMAWRAQAADLRIVERPILFEERVFGASKMSLGIVVEAMTRVTLWAVTGLPRRTRRRLRVEQQLASN